MNILPFLKSIINFIVPPAVIEYARGIDLSWWEGSFHPERATRPIHFAFTKFTEGTKHIDAKVDVIWQGVKQVIGRGGFHYQRSGYSWLAQADHFLSVASRFTDCQFFILDVERNKFQNAAGVLAYDNNYNDTFFSDMRRIIDHWRAKFPQKICVLYTNVDTYQNYIYPAMQRLYGDAGIQWLNSVLLWIAQPGTPAGSPNMPKQRSHWDFHQYSFAGKKEEYGTEGAVDENVFNGTVADLQKLIGAEIQPPPTEEPPPPPPVVGPVTEPTVYLAVAEASPIIVRKYPQAIPSTQTDLRIKLGEMFHGRVWAGNEYVWMQIEVSGRPELFGLWVAVRKIDGTGKLIKLIPLNAIPPTEEIPGSRIFQLRDARDPYLLQKISFGEKDNFGHLSKLSRKGGIGDVHQFLYLDDGKWLDYLLDVQLTNRYVEIDGIPTLVTRNQQKNWLYVPSGGRPYFDANGRFAFGDCVVPSQPIRIQTDASGNPLITYLDDVRLQDGTYNDVPMVKIDGFTPAMKSKPIEWLIKNAYIVEWTAISPAGKITKPLGMRQVNWSPDHFESNMGEKFIPLFYLKGYEL